VAEEDAVEKEKQKERESTGTRMSRVRDMLPPPHYDSEIQSHLNPSPSPSHHLTSQRFVMFRTPAEQVPQADHSLTEQFVATEQF